MFNERESEENLTVITSKYCNNMFNAQTLLQDHITFPCDVLSGVNLEIVSEISI